MIWKKKWIKKDYLIPAPLLVGVELNPGPSMDEDKRRDIVRWRKDGLGIKAIAKKLNVDIKSVRRWSRRGLKPPSKKPSFKNSPGQGRKRKLTTKQVQKVVKKAKGKHEDAPEISRELSKEVKGGVKEDTIRRTLKEHGLKYLVVEEREIITRDQAKRRIKFAKKMKDHDWKLALFTDEKTFQIGGHPHKSWQDPKDRQIEKVNRHPLKIHVWGGIGLHFKTKLYFFKGILNAKLYCKILKSRIPPEYAFNLNPYDRSKWIIVQDNDPKHKSKVAQELLDKLAPDRIRDWPSNSPDFNPIEDIWSMLDEELKRKGPKSLRALKTILTKSWENLDMEKVKASIESLPTRFQECRKLKGERTSY
jgi:transposase